MAKLVPNDQIAEQDYNLSVSTYVEQEDTREVIDIVKLNAEIEEIVAREQVLREEIAKIVLEIGEWFLCIYQISSFYKLKKW